MYPVVKLRRAIFRAIPKRVAGFSAQDEQKIGQKVYKLLQCVPWVYVSFSDLFSRLFVVAPLFIQDLQLHFVVHGLK